MGKMTPDERAAIDNYSGKVTRCEPFATTPADEIQLKPGSLPAHWFRPRVGEGGDSFAKLWSSWSATSRSALNGFDINGHRNSKLQLIDE